jgi:rRNA maturation endonuclease Nob1
MSVIYDMDRIIVNHEEFHIPAICECGCNRYIREQDKLFCESCGKERRKV